MLKLDLYNLISYESLELSLASSEGVQYNVSVRYKFRDFQIWPNFTNF